MQSSSLVSVITSSFLSAGLINPAAAIGIVFGAKFVVQDTELTDSQQSFSLDEDEMDEVAHAYAQRSKGLQVYKAARNKQLE